MYLGHDKEDRKEEIENPPFELKRKWKWNFPQYAENLINFTSIVPISLSLLECPFRLQQSFPASHTDTHNTFAIFHFTSIQKCSLKLKFSVWMIVISGSRNLTNNKQIDK